MGSRLSWCCFLCISPLVFFLLPQHHRESSQLLHGTRDPRDLRDPRYLRDPRDPNDPRDNESSQMLDVTRHPRDPSRGTVVNSTLVYFNRIPKTGSENMAFLIRHLAIKVIAGWFNFKCKKNQEFLKRRRKIPHTGDINSLDRCW